MRILEVSVTVDGKEESRRYAYDPLSLDLLEWSGYDPDASPSGVVRLTFRSSQVTDQPPA